MFAKIFEMVIKSKLTNFLETNQIFSSTQFGFRKNRSTIKAVLAIIQDIVEALEEGYHTAIMLCDLSKAFDCVSHNILIDKLKHFGVDELTLKFFRSYLSNRKQCVSKDQGCSDFLPVKHGVPQGSILGPVLFIIYINDFSYFMSPIKSVQFADDTSLICAHNDISHLKEFAQTCLSKAEEWFQANKLKLNSDKTQMIVISSNNKVPKDDFVKVLGVYIDDRLNWCYHVFYLSKKLASIIFLLRKLCLILNIDTLLTVYFGLFHSLINYGVILWGNSSHALSIFRQQKQAVRIIAGVRNRDHCKPHFIKFGILPLPCLFIFSTLVEIHENKDNFFTAANYHEYDTRNAHLIRTQRFRLSKSKNNSLNVALYNYLPLQAKNLSNAAFKSKIKKFLLRHCFYSVEEFLDHKWHDGDIT